MKTTSGEGSYIIFKSIFAFWDNVEHDVNKSWSFYLVWKLHQAGDITWLFSPFLPSKTFLNITLKMVEISAMYGNYIKRGIT